jgi:hypothetical protein
MGTLYLTRLYKAISTSASCRAPNQFSRISVAGIIESWQLRLLRKSIARTMAMADALCIPLGGVSFLIDVKQYD